MQSPWTDLDAIMRRAGVTHFAVTATDGGVDEHDRAIYRQFIDRGRHADMQYLQRHDDLRFDPAMLLPGAKSMVCCAIPYWSPLPHDSLPVARYAWGDDYHTAVRRRLSDAAESLARRFGGEYRVCVDTAPLRERYWAHRAQLGIIGLNNHLIVPGAGSYLFLAEIISTATLPAGTTTATPLPADCGRCGRCLRTCPTGAIRPDGSFDARKCLSYLTIEHRGPLPQGTSLHGSLYGCDRCAAACPHNADPEPCRWPELMPRESILKLTMLDIREMTPEQFSATFRNSAIKRTKLQGLQRNAAAIAAETQPNPCSVWEDKEI